VATSLPQRSNSNVPIGMAIDGAGHVWVTNLRSNGTGRGDNAEKGPVYWPAQLP